MNILHTIDDRTVWMDVELSIVPKFLSIRANIFAITYSGTVHVRRDLLKVMGLTDAGISKQSQRMALAMLLAHECRHGWQSYRYGEYMFDAMYIARVLVVGSDHKNSFERDAMSYAATHWPEYLQYVDEFLKLLQS